MAAMGKRLTLTCVGDISLQTNDGGDPFEYVSGYLSQGDIVFGNLETAITTGGKPADKAVALRAAPSEVRHLVEAGFHVLNLANNHTLDYGQEGFENTIEALRDNAIEYCGTWDQDGGAHLAVIQRNAMRVGFLGFMIGPPDTHIVSLRLDEIAPHVEQAARKVDILVVSMHWGEEYVFYPSPRQQRTARAIINAGAQLVVGHHPHVVQAIERYKGGCILYSLGNFQFGIPELRRRFPESDHTMLVNVTLDVRGPCDVEVVPALINDNYQPVGLQGPDKTLFEQFVREISDMVAQGAVTRLSWRREASKVFFRNHCPSFHRLIRTYGFAYLLRYLKWQVSPHVLMMRLGAILELVSKPVLSKPAARAFHDAGRTQG